MKTPAIDDYEQDILNAYEQGELQSVASKSEFARFKAAGRSTSISSIHFVVAADVDQQNLFVGDLQGENDPV